MVGVRSKLQVSKHVVVKQEAAVQKRSLLKHLLFFLSGFDERESPSAYYSDIV